MSSQRHPRTGRLAVAVLTLIAVSLPATAESSGRGKALLREAVEQERRLLADQIGLFASGERSVYRGDLAVVDSVAGGGQQVIPRGPAIGWLEERTRGNGAVDKVLSIALLDHGLWLQLSQRPEARARTGATRLRPLASSPGIKAWCTGFLAEFSPPPDDLHFTRFVAAGSLSDVSRSSFGIRVLGTLVRVETESLQLSDIESLLGVGLERTLAGGGAAFESSGALGVRQVRGEVRQRTEPPPNSPPQTGCELKLDYSGEQFVHLQDLTRFGFRGLTLLGLSTCCLDHGGHAESEICQPEEMP